MKKQSNRFTPSRLMELIIPVLLVILAVGLISVFVLVGLSLLGWKPGV